MFRGLSLTVYTIAAMIFWHYVAFAWMTVFIFSLVSAPVIAFLFASGYWLDCEFITEAEKREARLYNTEMLTRAVSRYLK